jgi:hypothetical protein
VTASPPKTKPAEFRLRTRSARGSANRPPPFRKRSGFLPCCFFFYDGDHKLVSVPRFDYAVDSLHRVTRHKKEEAILTSEGLVLIHIEGDRARAIVPPALTEKLRIERFLPQRDLGDPFVYFSEDALIPQNLARVH